MNKRIAIPVIAVLAIVLIVSGYFLWQQTDDLGEAKDEIVVLEDNVSTLEGNVASLETKLADSEAEVLTLESDLSQAQEQLESVRGELEAAQANISELTSSLEETRTELEATQADYDELNADYESVKSEYEALQAEHATLAEENSNLETQLEGVQSDLTNLQSDYDAASKELAEIKEVYPPRNFASHKELTEWLLEEPTSEKESRGDWDFDLVLAQKIQNNALRDGYIVSVGMWTDVDDNAWVACFAIADDTLYMWWTDSDEVFSLW